MVWEEGRTTSNPAKIRNVLINPSGPGIAIIDQNERVTFADYAILSLGFRSDNLIEKFANQGIPITKIRDKDNNTIGLGNEELGITINGSATQFGKEDFPDPIQKVIDVLGIAENTVALWVYNLLSTKSLWQTGTFDATKVRDLIKEHNSNDSTQQQLMTELNRILQNQSVN